MKIDTSRIKLIPEKSDTMSTEDTLREIVAFVELTKEAHNMGKRGFELYTRASFLKFCDDVISIVRQEVL